MSELIDLQERAAGGEPGWIDTPTARKVELIARQCHEERRLGIVRGGWGVGKSAALARYADVNGTAVMITLNPACRSQRDALKAILKGLIGPDYFQTRQTFSLYALYSEVSGALRDLAADGDHLLIIVDEAQHALTELLDCLRGLFDEEACGLVLSGNPTFFNAKRGRMDDARYGALWSRCDHWLDIPAPTDQDIDAFLDAHRVAGPESRKLLAQVAMAGGLRTMLKAIHRAGEIGGARLVRHGDLKAAVDMIGLPARAAPGWTRRGGR